MRLVAHSVSFSYRAARPVLAGVTVEVAEGSLVGIVGPNGAGKSTLLRCLCGAERPSAGRVTIDGHDVASMSPRDVARVLAVVPQSASPAFPVSVSYFVGMGRFSREPFLGGPTEADRVVVRRCLNEMGLASLAARPVDELSGGEFRRVLIAQALAQEPEALLFDEPVQQLDLLHQLEVMDFARRFTRRPGKAGAIVLHDLGLAARYCDTLVLLCEGRVLASGPPDEVLTAESLRRAYGVEASLDRCPATGALRVVAVRPVAAPEAAGATSFH